MAEAFLEVDFPSDIAYGATSTIRYLVAIETTEAGYERRTSRWSHGRREFDVATGIADMLREGNEGGEDQAEECLGDLISFFHIVGGPRIGFRFKDYSDFTTSSDHVSKAKPTDQVLGVGDGTTRVFEAWKTYKVEGTEVTNRRRLVKLHPGTVRVSIGDREIDPALLVVDHNTGMIGLPDAPEANQVVTFGCQFRVPVRFMNATLPVRLESYGVGSASVDLIEIML